jgi:small subunit ribosomal protein S21
MAIFSVHLPGAVSGRLMAAQLVRLPERIASTMAIRVKVRQNESIAQMLRRFKKLCEKEGLTKEVKRRQYYEKPSERRRRARRKSIARVSRLQTGI